MLTLSLVSRLLLSFQERAARIRTERLLGSLPLEIQKDIGWPPHAYEPGRTNLMMQRPATARNTAPMARRPAGKHALC